MSAKTVLKPGTAITLAIAVLLVILTLVAIRFISNPSQRFSLQSFGETGSPSVILSTANFGVQDNNSGSGRSVAEFDIIHTRWSWEDLMRGPGQVDLSRLKAWVTQNTQSGKRSMIGLLLNTTPNYLKQSQYDPIQGQYTNFVNPNFLNDYRNLVQKLCDEFCNNPNVIFEVNLGWDGEPRPHRNKNIYLTAPQWTSWRPSSQQQQEVTLGGGLARDAWMYWLYFATKTWADIAGAQRPVFVVTTQFFDGSIEHTFPFIKYSGQNINWIDYIKARNLGVKTTGFTFDTGKYWGPDYSWQTVMRSFAREGRPVSCEKGAASENTFAPEVFRLLHDEHFYWAAWAALDMGCNPFLLLHSQGTAYEWNPNTIYPGDTTAKATYLDGIYRQFYQESGKPVSQLKTAWIVLRESELTFDPYCRSTPNACDIKDFGYGITLKNPEDTIPEWNDYWSLSAGGSNAPYSPNSRIAQLDKNRTVEGRFTRRTDIASGHFRMNFDVDSQFISPGDSATIKIKYFDYGNGTWRFVTKNTAGEEQTARIQKTNTLTWKEASFAVENGAWDGSFATGADFYIDAGSDDDEFIHWIFVDKGQMAPTQTPTPTNPPPPTEEPQPTPTLIPEEPQPTPTPTPEPLTPDANSDGTVNMIDFEIFRQYYVLKDLRIDMFTDGIIDRRDFEVFKRNFGLTTNKFPSL